MSKPLSEKNYLERMYTPRLIWYEPQLTDEERQRLAEISNMVDELKPSISNYPPGTPENLRLRVKVLRLQQEWLNIREAARLRGFETLPEHTPDAILNRFIDILPDVIDEACLELRMDDPNVENNGLLDAQAVQQIVQTNLKPYFDYLRDNSVNNEYINATNYMMNLLADPNRFSAPSYLPQGDSYSSVSTSLTKVDADAPVQPTQLISPSDNVSNYTFKPRPTINVTDKPIPTYHGFTTVLSVEFENDDAVSISGGSSKLTAFDRFVHDAICTLFITDNPDMLPRNITPAMIYRVITGKPGSRIPPKQNAQIEQTIEKLRRTNISIKESNNAATDMQEISSHLISGMFGRRTFYGHVATVLRVTEVPILFSYAALKKQISRAPIDLFRIDGVNNYSTDFILVMQYLWRRINAMRSSSSLSRLIRFESIYENIDLSSQELKPSALANKKKAIRDHTKTILDSWQQTQRFIRGYTMKTKGREYIAVEIIVPKQRTLESSALDLPLLISDESEENG